MSWKFHLSAGITLQLLIGTGVGVVGVFWLHANQYSFFWAAIPMFAITAIIGWVWKLIPARCPFRGCSGSAFQHRDKTETEGRRGFQYKCDECDRICHTLWTHRTQDDDDHLKR